MKVLQIGKFYPIRGGVEKVMYDLMLGLSQRNISCDMLCASTEEHPAGTIHLNPFARLIVVPTQVKLAATMIAPAMIHTLRRIAHKYDIIHIHHPDPMANLALFLSGYKGKVVLHWHSDILKQKILLKVYAPLQSWLIKRADQIVGTTPVYVRESEALDKVQRKVDFIPIGVNPIQSDAEKVEEIRQKYADKKMIFSLGRLVEYKGYEYLIRAAQHLSTDYQILIGGTGPLKEKLSWLIEELKVADRVQLIGFVADEDLPNYFQAADVFCLSSIWKTEAFAIVQIEAMSCAKPVVSTAIPGSGVSWVNEDDESGIVVKICDAKSLADAIKEVLKSENYNRFSLGSKSRYKRFFTQEKMIDKCIKVYDYVLADTSYINQK